MLDSHGNRPLVKAPVDALIELALLGEPDAFSELIGRHRHIMRRTAFSILRNIEDAEDATQEASLRVFLRLGSFKGTSAFSTWVTRIVINTCLMRLRQIRRHPHASLDELLDSDGPSPFSLPDKRANPEQNAASSELRALVDCAIRELPPRLKEALQDHAYEEMSMQVMACKRGITVAAAKSRVYRARKALLDGTNSKALRSTTWV